MSEGAWVCGTCGDLYGGPENLLCACADAAPHPWEGGIHWSGTRLEGEPSADLADEQPVEADRGHLPSLDDDLDYADVDPLIRPFVRTLRYHGINTLMSCQGGEGHPDRLPWIRFIGDHKAAGRVAVLADHYAWPAFALDRRFALREGTLDHVFWALILLPLDAADATDARARLDETQRQARGQDILL